jgi:hypothetical protein
MVERLHVSAPQSNLPRVDNANEYLSEEQALARIDRLGQTKETYLTKMVVEKTVDDAMILSKDHIYLK